MPDWFAIARSSAKRGESPEESARDLIASGASPIDAIKAVREAFDVGLGAAKAIVHRNLPIEPQRAAERLWDEAERSLEME